MAASATRFPWKQKFKRRQSELFHDVKWKRARGKVKNMSSGRTEMIIMSDAMLKGEEIYFNFSFLHRLEAHEEVVCGRILRVVVGKLNFHEMK